MTYTPDKIRNIAIVGHQGSGKTSLVESLAYKSQLIKIKGTIENKNTISDYLPDEKKKQSSLSSSIIPLTYNGYKLNLIDIPGNDDFIFETIGITRLVKGAILVIDASKGVLVNTIKSFNLLKKRGVPIFIYVNKMDKENIKKLENQTDIKVFRLTNRIRTNAELSTFIQNMMHLPPRKNSRGYPHIFVVYANDDVEAENLLSDYIKQGYQWVEIEESERQEAQADLKMQAVRDMDKIVLLLDERYYYDEEGYLRAACFMKNGSSYVRKIFHRLNHARESIALVVKNNEKVYNTLLDLL